MSKTVDERVVSMQFDNAQFEKNVSTSMSTLDKLKKSLNLEGASKGLDHFVDVCVVLNKSSYTLYRMGKLAELNPQTRNKLYVACTRAHRHLYVMSYKWLEKYRMK